MFFGMLGDIDKQSIRDNFIEKTLSFSEDFSVTCMEEYEDLDMFLETGPSIYDFNDWCLEKSSVWGEASTIIKDDVRSHEFMRSLSHFFLCLPDILSESSVEKGKEDE